MKNFMLFLLAFLLIKTSSAQVNFENHQFLLDSIGKNYFKGTPGVPGDYYHTSGGASFALRNDTSAWGDFWSGWAISRLKDSISVAYDTNDCASIPAIGYSGSNNYATAYYSFDDYYNRIRFAFPLKVNSVYITNSTITYRSMKDGDGFAKKFGGVTGNDSDYYRITFYGWYNGVLTDSVTSYLADFRDTNNANDYIVKNWKYVDLLPLGVLDSMSYFLESSDTSQFGMNTPAYFCMDELYFQPESTKDLAIQNNFQVFPNPFENKINMQNLNNQNADFYIIDMAGKQMFAGKINANQSYQVNTNDWSKGIYLIRINIAGSTFSSKIVK